MPRFLLILLVSSTFIGCNKHKDAPPAVNPADLSPTELVQYDLKAIDSTPTETIDAYDLDHNGLFGKVFGGTSAHDIHHYMDTRISYYFTPEEMESFTMPDLPNSGMFSAYRANGAASEIEVGAANIGTQLWYMGLLNDTTVTVDNGEASIEISSPRAGLMMIGPGYKAEETDYYGDSIRLPIAYRQTVLVHEARHSDCTGGLTAQDVTLMKTLTSYGDTLERFNKMSCGHLHDICQYGDYKDIPACDRKPWGAYAVGLVYSEALADSYEGLDYEIMQLSIGDLRSRFEDFDIDQLLDGRLGEPDMTTQGVR
jgi:hypothetical protein